MSTLTVMKARIADELARSDLTSQIGYAINDAIAAYQDTEFSFNDSSFSFSTVADQEFYDSMDHANLSPDVLEKIYYVILVIGNAPRRLKPESPDYMEVLSTNGTFKGDPSSYSWFTEQLRLYPIPNAVRTIKMGAKVRIAAPATDGETGNKWMTDGERLIRCRAKFELFTHVIRNPAKADEMVRLISEAEGQLKDRQANLNRIDPMVTVEPMRF